MYLRRNIKTVIKYKYIIYYIYHFAGKTLNAILASTSARATKVAIQKTTPTTTTTTTTEGTFFFYCRIFHLSTQIVQNKYKVN